MRIALYRPPDHEPLVRFFDRPDQGFCFCRYWAFAGPNEAWLESSAAQHRSRALEEVDRMGVVAAIDGETVGWLRLERTDRVPKLRALGLETEDVPTAVSVLCMSVATEHRGRGVARAMLDRAIEALPSRGFDELRAYPRAEDEPAPGRVWTGPRALYERAGFTVVREASPRCTLRRALGAPRPPR